MKTYKNIYFDGKNHRYAIFLDAELELNFCYWHEFKRHGVRYIETDTYFKSRMSNRKVFPHSRGKCVDEIEMNVKDHEIKSDVICDMTIENEVLREKLLSKDAAPLVFIRCKFGDVEFEKLKVERSVAMIDCVFEGNFRFIDCIIKGSLWLSNSRFCKHFSLKSSLVYGDVHCESVDFSGMGGASFRGLKADNLYLDLGVKGSDDLIWLNEMCIDDAVSLGGTFHSEVQILGRQDMDEDPENVSSIGTIVIGKELYEFENANVTQINKKLRIEDILLKSELLIENIEVELIAVKGIQTSAIRMSNVSVVKDVVIDSCRSVYNEFDIMLVNSSVGRHCKIDKNEIAGVISLEGSAVSEVLYFEDNCLDEASKLNLKRFTASRLLIHPVEVLYQGAKSHLFKPKQFGLLKETSRRELADQYCALKHWLGDAGKLKHEDEAFFHMRHYYHDNLFLRAIFGVIFGWGVRLSNIALSSIVIILLFAALYYYFDSSTASISLAMSTQSFISSFFGVWGDYSPDGLIANLVFLESLTGVIFITVFVGAYIRKLLR